MIDGEKIGISSYIENADMKPDSKMLMNSEMKNKNFDGQNTSYYLFEFIYKFLNSTEQFETE